MRFEERDWRGIQRDSVERLDLYARAVRASIDGLSGLAGGATDQRAAWRSLKADFAERVARRADRELAETFFNSVVRRVVHTVGIDPELEFVDLLAPPAPPSPGAGRISERFPRRGKLRDLIGDLLARQAIAVGFEDLEDDASLCAHALAAQLGERRIEAVELARPVFYRNKGAYLVGRVLHGDGATPLVLALLNETGRVAVDAALLGVDALSLVFSYTRSYFFVDVEQPRELVGFLHSLMPRKPLAELYNAVGFNRHGKTELYRALRRQIEASDDRFEIAPGARGMVMTVFVLPSYDVVFKVIRDRFDEPKTTTREEVVAKYRLVFRHDRAGRLVDAQEFEYLAFDRERFSQPLLDELERKAPSAIAVDGRGLVIRHLYTERRLVPLDLYLREASPDAARRAILDYGQAIRDLAATNIFPGDLLLKNFGVTRLGRVVFYDYDEVCPVTDCNFREMPRARSDDEEMAGEAWYYVGERDVFPEEILPFLGLKAPLREVFLWAHGDLLTARFWNAMQERHRAGEVVDIFPYRPEQRLRRRE